MPVTSFAPVVVDATVPASPFGVEAGAASAEIEITVGMVLIRVRGVVDVKTLTTVLRAVKATS